MLIEFWKNHPDVDVVKWIQAKTGNEECEAINFESDVESNGSEARAADGEISEGDLGSEESESDEDDRNIKENVNKFALLSDE